jgi:hypothetical protein
VVLKGEGRGKISSPHLVNILGTKSLPKWECMIWIGSLYYFTSISMISEEKVGEINLQGHFNGRSYFGKLGFETSQSHFEVSNKIFWGKNFTNNSLDPMLLLYTSIYFQR